MSDPAATTPAPATLSTTSIGGVTTAANLDALPGTWPYRRNWCCRHCNTARCAEMEQYWKDPSKC